MANDKPQNQTEQTGFLPEPERKRGKLPADLPDPAAAQTAGRPNGAKYRASDGQTYVLVHASWRRPAAKRSKPAPTAPPTQS